MIQVTLITLTPLPRGWYDQGMNFTDSIAHMAGMAFRAFEQLRKEGHLDSGMTTVEPDFVYDAVSDQIDGTFLEGDNNAFDMIEAMVSGFIDNHFD